VQIKAIKVAIATLKYDGGVHMLQPCEIPQSFKMRTKTVKANISCFCSAVGVDCCGICEEHLVAEAVRSGCESMRNLRTDVVASDRQNLRSSSKARCVRAPCDEYTSGIPRAMCGRCSGRGETIDLATGNLFREDGDQSSVKGQREEEWSGCKPKHVNSARSIFTEGDDRSVVARTA